MGIGAQLGHQGRLMFLAVLVAIAAAWVVTNQPFGPLGGRSREEAIGAARHDGGLGSTPIRDARLVRCGDVQAAYACKPAQHWVWVITWLTQTPHGPLQSHAYVDPDPWGQTLWEPTYTGGT
jgi:hypothetical protein